MRQAAFHGTGHRLFRGIISPEFKTDYSAVAGMSRGIRGRIDAISMIARKTIRCFPKQISTVISS